MTRFDNVPKLAISARRVKVFRCTKCSLNLHALTIKQCACSVACTSIIVLKLLFIKEYSHTIQMNTHKIKFIHLLHKVGVGTTQNGTNISSN